MHPSRRLARAALGLCLGFALNAAAAPQSEPESVPATEPQADAPVREDAVVLETLVVSGKMPGPGMWKVSRDGHTMWILGTLQPVPKRMEWESDEVAERIAAAEVILMPAVFNFDLGMGRFRQLMLLPSLLGARKNPEKGRLQDQVSAEDYARWLVLKDRYMGRSRKVEGFRPVFAASELNGEALEASGLRHRALVSPLIDKLAREHDIPLERPRLTLRIENPRQAIREFREARIDDAQCFHQMLEHLENDLVNMRIRANAWARGDLLTLREVSFTDPSQACVDAVFQSRFAKEQGIDNLAERLDALWLENAEKLIAAHATSFAALPMGKLLGENGQLAALAARGYRVDEP